MRNRIPPDIAALLKAITPFTPRAQLQVMHDIARDSRELDGPIIALANVINTMPHTYQQDGLGDKAMVHLHYFSPGADWYITEKDKGDPSDPEPSQAQAFGLACIMTDELGYISLDELCRHPSVNVDLHWTPKTVGECRSAWMAKHQ